MASIRQVSLPTPDQVLLTQTVQLDGESYVFEFDWNTRMGVWVLNILSSTQERILDGIVLVPNFDLTRNIAANTPPGVLFLFSPSEQTPDREGISECALFYVPAEEVGQ